MKKSQRKAKKTRTPKQRAADKRLSKAMKGKPFGSHAKKAAKKAAKTSKTSKARKPRTKTRSALKSKPTKTLNTRGAFQLYLVTYVRPQYKGDSGQMAVNARSLADARKIARGYKYGAGRWVEKRHSWGVEHQYVLSTKLVKDDHNWGPVKSVRKMTKREVDRQQSAYWD